MPRRKSPPRLWLDRARKQWVIRDGPRFVRTGRPESDREGAEKQLAAYLGHKHKPESGPDPLIADVLMVYAQEHLPHTRSAKNGLYNIENLSRGMSGLHLRDISAALCRAFASGRETAARRDLEVLRAAVNYWARERGPISSVPQIVLPRKSEPRERWLTRSEAARLLWAARRVEHLKRFILIGLYTGSRSGAILNLKWDWIDVERGIMRRREQGDTESNKRTPPVRLGRLILSFLRRWRGRDMGGGRSNIVHYNGASVQKLRRSWQAAAARAGLVGISPHTLRHTRATWLMQAGIDVWEAAGHLGMSVETLQRVYAKHHPDFQKRAAEV